MTSNKSFNGAGILRSLVALFAGTIFVLTIFEAALRVAHVMRSARTAPENTWVSDWNEPSTVRIVVLGESTSGPYYIAGRDISWPIQLERQLNERFSNRNPKVHFRVLNLARASSSSPFQVARFEASALQVKPDILISMIGVNDGYVKPLADDVFYENFYVARFLYWADVAWGCPKCHELQIQDSVQPQVSERAQRMVDEVLKQLPDDAIKSKSDVDRFHAWRAGHEASEADDRHYVNAIVAERLFTISEQPRLKKTELGRAVLLEAKAILDRSYREMVMTRSSSLEHYCHIHAKLQETGCAQALKEAVQSGFQPTPQVMTLAAHHGANHDEFLRKLYRGSGLEVTDERNDQDILANSYLRLERVVRDLQIVWMPMQYPTGSVGALEYYLSDDAVRAPRRFRDTFQIPPGQFQPRFKDTIRISNENFNAIVSRENATEYYLDFFARVHELNFGHTTEKGHSLIAANVTDQIEKSWPEIEPRIKSKRDRQRDRQTDRRRDSQRP